MKFLDPGTLTIQDSIESRRPGGFFSLLNGRTSGTLRVPKDWESPWVTLEISQRWTVAPQVEGEKTTSPPSQGERQMTSGLKIQLWLVDVGWIYPQAAIVANKGLYIYIYNRHSLLHPGGDDCILG